MKRNFLMMTLLGLALAFGAPHSFAQGKGKKLQPMRFAEGEEVWVVVNTVKADKREQFENFMLEIFLPLGKKMTGADRKAFSATRLLLPSKANEDGTWTYLYLMDPVIKGAEYDIGKLLKRFYDEAKTREFAQKAEEIFARPQVVYMQKQGRLNTP